MKKRMLLFAAVVLSAVCVLGYAVDTTHSVFCFEDGEVMNRSTDGSSWLEGDTIYNVTNHNLTASSQPNFYRVGIEKPGVTVKSWGLSTSMNIANANWMANTAATTFLCAYDSAYASVSKVYLYVWLKWMHYGIAFEPNGGSAVSSLTDICYTNSIALPTSARVGYTFGGWTNGTVSTALNGSKTGSDLGVSEDGATIPLYAKWTANTYTVTFDRQGGSGGTASVAAAYDAAMPAVTLPTRTGYTFGGYYTAANGGGTQYYTAAGASVRSWDKTSATTLYAKWTANTYAVTFDKQSGSGGTASVTATYGSAMPSITVPSRTGYTFGGYYTAANGGGTQYYQMNGTSARSWDKTGATTLYAKWTANTYTVTFDANGGGVSPTSATVTYGSTYGELPSPSWAGHVFDGWYTRITDGTKVTASTPVAITSGHTLYAHWTINTYTVTFKDWNGTVLKTQTVNYGAGATPPASPTRTGYTFAGWSGTYTDVTSSQTVTATYTVNEYTVTLNTNGGTVNAGNVQSYTYGTGATLPTDVTRLGYDFKGWYANSSLSGTRVTAIGADATGNRSFHARWRRHPVVIWFDPNGGTLADGDRCRAVGYGRAYGESLNLYGNHPDDFNRISGGVSFSENVFTLTATAAYPGNWLSPIPAMDTLVGVPVTYVLYLLLAPEAASPMRYCLGAGNGGTATSANLARLDWEISEAGVYVLRTSVKNASSALSEPTFDRAFWTCQTPGDIIGAKVMYRVAAYVGDLADGQVAAYTAPDSFISVGLPEPLRAGYTCNGWYTAKSAGLQMTASSTVSILSGQTLYAHWTANTYTVRFDPNGGTGTMSSIGCTYDTATALTSNTFTRSGYTFVGWATNSTGSVVYADGAQMTAGTTVNNGTLTLYAKWTPNTYVVTFDKQSGSGGTASVTATYGSAMPTVTPPTRTGCTFGGYYTAANGGGTQYYKPDGTSARSWDKASATTLYAKWTPNPYTVTYSTNGGTVNAGNVSSYTYGAGATLPTDVTRVGYDFKGWYTNSTFSGTRVTAIGTGEYGNKAFYARWRRKCIAVKFDPDGGTLANGDNLRVVGQRLKYGESVNFYGDHNDDFARFTGGITLSDSGIMHSLNCTAAYPGGWMSATDLLDDTVGSPVTYVLYVTSLTSAPEGLRFLIGAGNGGASTSAILSAGAADVSTTGRYVIRTTVANTSIALTDPVNGKTTFDRAFWNASSPTGVVGMTASYAFSVYGGHLPDSAVANRSNPDGSVSAGLPVTTKDGYVFAGWYTAKSGGDQVTDSTTVTNTSAQTLYAHWTAAEYTVTLDWQDESGGTNSVRATYGSAMPTVTPPARTGYTFSGCYDAVSGGTQYYTEAGASARSWDKATNTTLYAHWAANTYTVTFDKQSGSGGTASVTATYGSAMPTAMMPTRTGYTFRGYYAGENGSGTQYYTEAGASVQNWNQPSNTTLYAQWEANTYTVVYDANGGDGGSMTNDVFTYDREYGLQSNACTRALHTFLGWASTPDAATNEVEYVDMAIVSNLTTVANGTNTLYAVWRSLLTDYSTAADCTNLVLACTNGDLKWDIDGTGGYASDSSAYAAGDTNASMTAELSGPGTLTFMVKAKSDQPLEKVFSFSKSPVVDTGVSLPEVKEAITGRSSDETWVLCTFAKESDDVDVYEWTYNGFSEQDRCWVDQVHWYPGRFVRVTKDSTQQGGTDDLSDSDLGRTIRAIVLERWDEWNDILFNSVSNVEMYCGVNDAAVANVAAMLEAGLKPTFSEVSADGTQATLKFDEIKTILTLACSPEAGGIVTNVEGSLIGDAERVVTVAAEPAEAYVFSRWSDGSTELTNMVTVVTNTELTAYFTYRTNEVVFLDWDGARLGPVLQVAYGEGATPPEPPSRIGYVFRGWSEDFSSVTNDMEISALYDANRYTVRFDANGGTGSMADLSCSYGTATALTPNSFTWTGFAFVGWATNSTGSVVYGNRANITTGTVEDNGMVMLYAVWREQSDYSIAADCPDLLLVCTNEMFGVALKWDIDYSSGFSSTSAVHVAGDRMAFMTTEISGTGTLTFRAKCAKSSLAGSAVTFDVYEEKDSQTEFYKKIDDTGDEWMICSYFKGNTSNRHVIWRFSGWSDDDKSWVDQVHWYPGKSVTVQGNNIDSSVSAEVMEAILQNWDAILGENSTSISTVVATGPAVTNAVALLNGGYRPEVDTSVVPPTLTFNEVTVLDVSISEFSVTNLPFATLKATISPHGTPPDVGVWGAPTLTSGWSQVESEGDFSKFAAEGIVSFEFDVSTNRFFKVITK